MKMFRWMILIFIVYISSISDMKAIGNNSGENNPERECCSLLRVNSIIPLTITPPINNTHLTIVMGKIIAPGQSILKSTFTVRGEKNYDFILTIVPDQSDKLKTFTKVVGRFNGSRPNTSYGELTDVPTVINNNLGETGKYLLVLSLYKIDATAITRVEECGVYEITHKISVKYNI